MCQKCRQEGGVCALPGCWAGHMLRARRQQAVSVGRWTASAGGSRRAGEGAQLQLTAAAQVEQQLEKRS